jgi:hypothetical protein
MTDLLWAVVCRLNLPIMLPTPTAKRSFNARLMKRQVRSHRRLMK